MLRARAYLELDHPAVLPCPSEDAATFVRDHASVLSGCWAGRLEGIVNESSSRCRRARRRFPAQTSLACRDRQLLGAVLPRHAAARVTPPDPIYQRSISAPASVSLLSAAFALYQVRPPRFRRRRSFFPLVCAPSLCRSFLPFCVLVYFPATGYKRGEAFRKSLIRTAEPNHPFLYIDTRSRLDVSHDYAYSTWVCFGRDIAQTWHRKSRRRRAG